MGKTVSNIDSNTNQGTVVKFHPSRGEKKCTCALLAILRYIKKACSGFVGKNKTQDFGSSLFAARLTMQEKPMRNLTQKRS